MRWVPLLVGTSGWHYRHWRGGFYPPGLPARRWLDHYAARFATVELNNAFYRLPEADTFAMWARELPEGFVVSVKMSRYLTHIKRLHEPAEPVERFLSRAHRLGAKLGPVLLQLPPNLTCDTGSLREVLSLFPADVRVAFEPRHDSWFVDEVRDTLADRNAAFCLADRGGVLGPEWATADWGYVRFHCGRARPECCYGRAALARWIDRVSELWPRSAEVFVYFNNDGHGCAPRDAHRFAYYAERAGLEVSRVPGRGETPVAAAG